MADKDYTVRAVINGKDNASGVFKKFGNSVKRSMKLAAAAAGAAAAAFAGISFKWASDFESQMSSVQAISQATGAEIGALTDKAKQLGKDSAFSATEAGEAMEFLARAGFSTEEVLDAVGATLDLAAAGSLDLGEAADIASNILTGFNLSADKTKRVVDAIATTAANANTNVAQMGEAMAYVAPLASAAGFSLEVMSAAVGMLGNAGIQGSRAGTTLRQAITKLLDPTDDARKSMSALGLSLVDANGQMKPFSEIIAQIPADALDSAEGLKHINKIFGTRAAPGIIALVKQGSDNLIQFSEDIKNSAGTAEEMAKTKLDNVKGAFTLLKSSIQAVGIALFTGGGEDNLNSSIKSFVTDSLIPAVNKTAAWIEAMGGIPGIAKTVAEVIVILGETVTNSIVALGDWETFSDFIVNLGKVLVEALQMIGDFSLGLLEAIVEVGKTLWLPFITPFAVMLDKLREKFVTFINWLGEKFTSGINSILGSDFVQGFADKLGIEIDTIDWEPIVNRPAITMEDSWSTAWSEVGMGFQRGVSSIKMGAEDAKTHMEAAGTKMKDAMGQVNPELLTVGERIDDIVAKNKETVKATEEVGSTAVWAFGDFGTAAEGAAETVDEDSSLYTSIVELGKAVPGEMKQGWENYINNMETMTPTIAGTVEQLGKTMQGELSSAIETAMSEGKISFKDGFEAMADVALGALSDKLSATAMKSIIGPAVDALTGGLSGAVSSGLSGIGGGGGGGGGAGVGGLGALGTAGAVLGGVGLAAGTVVALHKWATRNSKSVDDQVKEFIGDAETDAELYEKMTDAMDNRLMNRAGTGGGRGSHNVISVLWKQLDDSFKQQFFDEGGHVAKWARAFRDSDFNRGYGGMLSYHSGGTISGEGLFLGLSGEGVLNRKAMQNVGAEGLKAMNEGKAPAARSITFNIQAFDGDDVEQAVRKKIIPALMNLSEAGEYVVYDSGVRPG